MQELGLSFGIIPFFLSGYFEVHNKKERKFMRINMNVFIGLLLFVLLLAGCQKGEHENPPLAKFDGGTITQNEYIDLYLFSTLYKPEVFPSEESLREYVSKIAINNLVVQEAKNRKFDEQADFKEALSKKEDRNLYFTYMRQEFIDAIINDSLINKFYDEFSPQYHMAYIMRPFLQDSPEKFVKSQKDSIEFVYKLLMAGEDFKELAKKYSQDSSTKDKGGDLGFVIGESMGDAQIRAVMDTLKEFSYSKPFRGFNGYYILYKGEKREVPVPPIEQAKGRIWQSLYRIRRHEISAGEQKRFESLAPRYHYQIHEKVIEQIKKKVGGSELPKYAELNFSLLSEEDLSQELATFDNGSILVSELFEDRRKAPHTMLEFRDRLEKKSKERILAQHARELGIQNMPDVAEQIKKIKDDLLKTYLLKREIKDKVQALVDSLNQLSNSDQQQESLRKTRFDRERELQLKLEEDLKNKYHFEFLPENFNQALREATKRKEQQNKEREEKKSK